MASVDHYVLGTVEGMATKMGVDMTDENFTSVIDSLMGNGKDYQAAVLNLLSAGDRGPLEGLVRQATGGISRAPQRTTAPAAATSAPQGLHWQDGTQARSRIAPDGTHVVTLQGGIEVPLSAARAYGLRGN